MKRLLPLLIPLGGGFFFMSSAHAADGQTNVVCAYNHTLGDDAIMMYGKPNEAMWHDFFGNTSTDAFSTYTACAPMSVPPVITKRTPPRTGRPACVCRMDKS